jgi:hypothetical protein
MIPGKTPVAEVPIAAFKNVTLNNYSVVAAAASFALSGQAAGLRNARKITAAGTSFTLSGQAVATRFGGRVAGGAGAFVLTGFDVGIRATRTMPSAVGAFLFTAQGVGLHKGFRSTAEATSFALAGFDVELKKGRFLFTEPGVFVLSGATASLIASHIPLPAGAASFVMTGNAVDFLVGRRRLGISGSGGTRVSERPGGSSRLFGLFGGGTRIKAH